MKDRIVEAFRPVESSHARRRVRWVLTMKAGTDLKDVATRSVRGCEGVERQVKAEAGLVIPEADAKHEYQPAQEKGAFQASSPWRAARTALPGGALH